MRYLTYPVCCADGTVRTVFLTPKGERILRNGEYRANGWRGITWTSRAAELFRCPAGSVFHGLAQRPKFANWVIREECLARVVVECSLEMRVEILASLLEDGWAVLSHEVYDKKWRGLEPVARVRIVAEQQRIK